MVAKSCWLIEGSPWLVQNKTLKRDFRQRAISATDASSCGDISTPVGAARKPSKSPLFTNSHRWRRVRTWFSTATWSKQLHVTVNIRLSWVSKHQEHRKILSGTVVGSESQPSVRKFSRRHWHRSFYNFAVCLQGLNFSSRDLTKIGKIPDQSLYNEQRHNPKQKTRQAKIWLCK